MNAKRFVSEPFILAFVALVDLASVSALVICHRDMTIKESQAAAQVQIRDELSSKETTPATHLAHYSPSTSNALSHPADIRTKEGSQTATVTAPGTAHQ